MAGIRDGCCHSARIPSGSNVFGASSQGGESNLLPGIQLTVGLSFPLVFL